MVKIATYNVNSVKARLPNLLEWLKESAPDIVCLQELKCVEEAFPRMEIEDMGYNLAIYGQKTYNGVAILSKYKIDESIKGLPTLEGDEQARYIECVISVPHNHPLRGTPLNSSPPAGEVRRGGALQNEVLRICSVYVPNGGEPNGEKWQYKMKFFDSLREHIRELLTYNEKLIIAGDYNVAPENIDVFDPISLRGTTCFHPDEQEKWRSIVNLGLTDAWRACHPQTQSFSWWDYRSGGWQGNKGMRIDHLLLSPQAADIVKDAGIDENTRGREKASDHAPVWCSI